MKRFSRVKVVAILLVCLGLVMPHSSGYAAGRTSAPKKPVAMGPDTKGPVARASVAKASVSKAPAAKAPVISDLALGTGGTLRGKVVDRQGIAVDGAPVSVRYAGKEVATSVTDRDGQFQVAQLRGGAYHVVAGNSQGLYRAWSPDTAPPSAVTEAVLVSNPEPIVRGQSEGDMQEWNSDQEEYSWDYVKIGAFALAGIAGGFAISEAVENNKLKNDNSDVQAQADLLRRQRDALQAQLNHPPASP